MKKIFAICFVLASSIAFIGCSSKQTGEGNHETGEEKHEEHENSSTVSLTPEQMKSIHIQFGSIEKKQLTTSLKANGFLKVPNQNKANVTVLMGGVLKTILVQPGNQVTKGQVIATIANTSFISLQAEFLSVSSKLNLAELEYARQKELSAENATAMKQLQQSEAELKEFKARKASIQKQLELVGINATTLNSENIQPVVSIISPISGSVSKIMVNIGSFVDANTPIAEIIDNSQLHLDLYVYERDLSKLKIGQTIHFTLTNNPGKEYDADIYAIGNTFEENTKAVAVHATVKGDKNGLIDGMSITGLISLENATVNAVPENAIVNFAGQDYIFIQTDAHTEEEHHTEGDGHKHDKEGHKHEENKTDADTTAAHEQITFERILIVKGTTDVGYSEITLMKEIPADSKIVVNGAFFLLGKMTNSGEHEH